MIISILCFTIFVVNAVNMIFRTKLHRVCPVCGVITPILRQHLQAKDFFCVRRFFADSGGGDPLRMTEEALQYSLENLDIVSHEINRYLNGIASIKVTTLNRHMEKMFGEFSTHFFSLQSAVQLHSAS